MRWAERRRRGREGSSSINLQVGAGVVRLWNAEGHVGGRQSQDCPPVEPLMPGSLDSSEKRVQDRDAGQVGQQARKGRR